MERAALTRRVSASDNKSFRGHKIAEIHLFNLLKGGMALLMCLIISAVSGQSRVQVVNLVTAPTSGNLVDIYLESDLLMNDVPQGFSTAFLELTPGQTYHLSVAPASSTSVSDTVYSMSFFMIQEQQFIVAFYGEMGNPASPVSHMLEINGKRLAADPNQVDVSFVHLATGEGAIDMVKREGGMVFGNLAYGEISGYLPFDTIEHYLDIKYTGTSNIIATYRLSLEAYKGQALKVFALGDASLPYTFSLFAVYRDGFTIPVDYAPLARVQYFNTLADTVDVYKNGTRFSDNTVHGGAMPYKNIPADFNFNIAVSPWSSMNANGSWGTFSYTFENTKTYAAVTTGIINDNTYPLEMFFAADRLERAPAGQVALTFFNGLYGFSDLDIEITGAGADTLFEGVAYGDFTAYTFTDSAAFNVNAVIRKAGTMETLFSLALSLMDYTGEALTLALARTAGADTLQGLELWAIKSNGESELLKTVSTNGTPEAGTFILYPNPVTGGDFSIQFKNVLQGPVQWRLYDSALHLASEGVFSEGQSVYHLNVENKMPGIYFLEIFDKSFNIYKKIFIQKS